MTKTSVLSDKNVLLWYSLAIILLSFRRNHGITFSIGFPGRPYWQSTYYSKTLQVHSLSLGPNIIDRPVSIVSEFISLSKKSAPRQPNYRATWPPWCKIFYEGAFFLHAPVFSRDIYVKVQKLTKAIRENTIAHTFKGPSMSSLNTFNPQIYESGYYFRLKFTSSFHG